MVYGLRGFFEGVDPSRDEDDKARDDDEPRDGDGRVGRLLVFAGACARAGAEADVGGRDAGGDWAGGDDMANSLGGRTSPELV